MIYEDKNFEKKYLESIKQLGELNKEASDVRLGKKLQFIIQDFIGTLTDWNMEIQTKTSANELFAKTWKQCRNFVLPMNPVRKELEFAVKASLKALGVNVSLKSSKKSAVKPAAEKKPAKKAAKKTAHKIEKKN